MKNVAESLQGRTDLESLRNTWSFVHDNITYQKDQTGHEIIKNPAVLYYYGKGDCKSFSLMIASILSHYPGIEPSFRFTAYPGDRDFVHVYTIAKIKGRKDPVILDATLDKFDYEVPYERKKDYSMTMISHMHGAPGVPTVRRRVSPSIAEAYADGPKRAVLPAVANIASLSQGELRLNLLKNKLILRQNYYGDPTGVVAKGIFMIEDALAAGLQNYTNPTGVVDSVYDNLIRNILTAKGRHVQQVINLAQGVSVSGIGKQFYTGGLNYEGLKKCIETIRPEKADWFFRNFSSSEYVDFEGSSYKMNPAMYDCVKAQLLIQWAKQNIFETENFRKGSHHMLYEFANGDALSLLNQQGIVKRGFHQTWVDAFANLSGLDRDNVRLYIENGISYTSAQRKLSDIEPIGSITALVEGIPYKDDINKEFGIHRRYAIGVDPVTAALTAKEVVGIIIGAVSLITAAIKTMGATNQSRLLDQAQGIQGSSQSARIEDMIKSQELLGNIVPILLVGAGAFLLLTNKSKKSA